MSKETPEPTVAIEEITPEKAKKMLAGNTHNRNIRERHWRAIARDMKKNRYKFTGDSIKISPDDVVVDGQHRLLAIIESNKTQKMVVVRNVPMDAQQVVDAVARRTFADTLRLEGEVAVTDKAALVNKLIQWETDTMRGNYLEITRREQYARWQKDKALIIDACLLGARIGMATHNTLAPRSLIALAYMLFSNVDSEDADDFFDKLQTGANLAEDDPIYALRRILTQSDRSSSGLENYRKMGLFIKAWNAYRTGARVKQLSFRTGGKNAEDMPDIK